MHALYVVRDSRCQFHQPACRFDGAALCRLRHDRTAFCGLRSNCGAGIVVRGSDGTGIEKVLLDDGVIGAGCLVSRPVDVVVGAAYRRCCHRRQVTLRIGCAKSARRGSGPQQTTKRWSQQKLRRNNCGTCAQLKLHRSTTMDKMGIAVNKAVDHCKGGRPPTKRATVAKAGNHQQRVGYSFWTWQCRPSLTSQADSMPCSCLSGCAPRASSLQSGNDNRAV